MNKVCIGIGYDFRGEGAVFVTHGSDAEIQAWKENRLVRDIRTSIILTTEQARRVLDILESQTSLCEEINL